MSDQRVELRDVQCLNPPSSLPPMTHYRCIKFDPQSEVALVVRKLKSKRTNKKIRLEQNVKDNDETIDTLSTTVFFFTLLSGHAESFGISINSQKLYSLNLGQRFVLQTFESGIELCFLVLNQIEDNIEPSTNFRKNEMRFTQLKSPFTAFNLKTLTLDTQLLSTVVQLDSRKSQLPNHVAISIQNNVPERYRLDINTKCYQNKTTKWLYPKYVQIAQELNRQRQEATNTNQIGPNVIIMGPCDSGKSTLAKLIINYAIKEQYSPMYVDLDVGQGAIGVPGVIGAGIIDQHCLLHQDYHFRSGHPIQVHFGCIDPSSNKDIHKLSVNCLAVQIDNFLRSEEVDKSNQTKIPRQTLTKWSGLVINTHGWIDGYGYESTLDAINKFSVSTVLVLGDARHKWNFNHKSDSQVQVHYFPPNNSTIKRSQKLRGRLRIERFARYFTRQVTTVLIPFDNHQIFSLYSWNNFFRILKGEQKQNQNHDRNGNLSKMILNQIYPNSNYKICKVEKIRNDRKGGLNYDRVVFYHLNREMILQLKNQVFSLLTITIDQLQNQSYCFSQRELLQVRGHARVVQIDLETCTLLVELPSKLSSMLHNGKQVLLLNDAMLRNSIPKGKNYYNSPRVKNRSCKQTKT